MPSEKSYLVAQASWDDPDADTSSPLCSKAAQTFGHAFLSCPSSACQRSRLLQGVSELAPEAPIWSDQQPLIALAEFIHTTPTGFPPRVPPLARSLHSPPNRLFRSNTPPAPGP